MVIIGWKKDWKIKEKKTGNPALHVYIIPQK
jgi:hypothetical protein